MIGSPEKSRNWKKETEKKEIKKQGKPQEQLPNQKIVRFIAAFECYRSKTLKIGYFLP